MADVQFRPTLWPTLIAIPAIAILLSLGWWQVQRLQYKTDFIQELEIRGAAAAIPLPTDVRIPAEDLVFRRVKVTGHYMHEAEMHLLNQVRDGVPGVNVFTPLVRADGGGVLLVNRGWAPINWSGAAMVDLDNEPVAVEVTGVVRTENPPNWLTPDNAPEKNAWYFIDLADMSRASSILPFTDFYIYATGEKHLLDEQAPELVPAPNVWRVNLPNNHLMYAITWFSLACVLLVIYVIFHTMGRDADDD